MGEAPKKSRLTSFPHRRVYTEPFDRFREPPRQNLFLMPLIWLLCRIMTLGHGLKIEKHRMEGLKPPYLVLCTHHAFMDFYVTPLALFPHRANYISELEGFEAFGEWIYRQAGCLGTRKFVSDMALIKNIRRVIGRKGIMVIYPEARYANVGTSSELPASVGKLAKNLGVPVVTVNMHGNYLQSPIWNLKKRSGVPLSAEVTQLFTREELSSASAEEINAAISEKLSYDEYHWQLEKGIRITSPWRAEGLHKALYRCCKCGAEHVMDSRGTELFCKGCGFSCVMDEYGRLLCDGGEFEYSHIPDWYEWQREMVSREIDRGEYRLDITVQVEALPNAKNFIDCGEGRLIHDENGFTLTFTECGEEKTLRFPPLSMTSVHTEYDYRSKWGECITLSTVDDTYFLFPRGDGFSATRIQLATEYLYKKAKSSKG